jgi:hypothetical protein
VEHYVSPGASPGETRFTLDVGTGGTMDQESLILRERDLLKTELQALKHCQVQYFSFAITATGVIFGLAEKIGDKPAVGLVYLIPLLLVIPLWSIFFDKASSITRIVGYMRILEALLVGDKRFRYQGWENALRDFRDADKRHHFLADPFVMVWHAMRAVWPLIDFRRQHRYWAINWLSFCGLGICSLYMAKLRGADPRIFLLFTVFFVGACIHNADVLWDLVGGNFGYDKREAMWQVVLTAQPSASGMPASTSANNTPEPIVAKRAEGSA